MKQIIMMPILALFVINKWEKENRTVISEQYTLQTYSLLSELSHGQGVMGSFKRATRSDYRRKHLRHVHGI